MINLLNNQEAILLFVLSTFAIALFCDYIGGKQKAGSEIKTAYQVLSIVNATLSAFVAIVYIMAMMIHKF